MSFRLVVSLNVRCRGARLGATGSRHRRGSNAEADRHEHRVAGRLLRGPGRERHGPAHGPELRRLQRRAAPGRGHPVARAELLATPAQREISRLDDAIDKVVVSDSLTADQTDPWGDTRRIVRRADAHERIAELKQRSGRDILVFGSRTLWNDLLTAGLVDELHLMLGPVVLGGGTPVFDNQPTTPLRLLDTQTWEGSDNVLVRYAAATAS
jgi:hypothetical protein